MHVDFDNLILSVEEHNMEAVFARQLVERARPEHKILVRDTPRVGSFLETPLIHNATSLAPNLEEIARDSAILVVYLNENRTVRHALGVVASVNDAIKLLQLDLVHDLLEELIGLAVLVNEELEPSILNVALNLFQNSLFDLC